MISSTARVRVRVVALTGREKNRPAARAVRLSVHDRGDWGYKAHDVGTPLDGKGDEIPVGDQAMEAKRYTV